MNILFYSQSHSAMWVQYLTKIIELTHSAIFYSQTYLQNWSIKQLNCQILPMYVYTYSFYCLTKNCIITFSDVCKKLNNRILQCSNLKCTISNHNKSIFVFYILLTHFLKCDRIFDNRFAWSHSVIYVQNRTIKFYNDATWKCMHEIEP